MILRNLTPHKVIITIDSCGDNLTFTLDPEDTFARIVEESNPVRYLLDGILEYEVSSNGVEGLPEPKDDTLLIVSARVADTIKRPDLRVPYQSIRDDDGMIMGCKGLRKPIK